MTGPSFAQTTQSLNPGSAWVELFSLDCTPIGGGVYYWTPGPFLNGSVSFGGIAYASMPIEGVNFEWNGQGPLPTPKLRISNIQNIPMGLLIANKDCLGAQVTRVRTFLCYLDGQEYADPGAATIPDVFRVDRKSHADKNFVELELAASIDQQGKQLPFRQVLQGTCTQTYRSWNGETFVQGSCPYTGTAYFDNFTVSQTNPALDNCGRRLRDCVARFGKNPLPTYAFPGVALTPGIG